MTPFIEALSEFPLIQPYGFRDTLERAGIQPAAFNKQPIMHGPVASLRSCAAGRHGSFDSDAAICPRIVSIDKLDLAGVDVRSLQLWQGLLEKFHAIATSEIRVLDQGQRRIGLALDAPVIRDRTCTDIGYPCAHEHETQQQPGESHECIPHVRAACLAFLRSSSPAMSNGHTTVASLSTSAKRPPSSGGTNFPQDTPS